MARFKPGNPGLQFVTDKVWISALGIHYKLGINGLNVALMLLTTVLFTVSLAWSAMREWDRPARLLLLVRSGGERGAGRLPARRT